MKINDEIYGGFTIKERVIIELIKSKPVQRLKRISQSGAAAYVIKGRNTNRYDHSIGVMLLLRKLNASIEEQIAGLLHDVPHTAFSHVVDHIFRSEEYDYHDKFHESIIFNSEIPIILEKYNYNTKYILNAKNFHLLERKCPDLCADRVDYALRDRLTMFKNNTNLKVYSNSLIVQNSEIIFNNRKSAINFALEYLEMADISWSSNFEGLLSEILAAAIKIAIDKKIISKQDLFNDDKYIFNKLHKSKNKKILEKLNLIKKDLEYTEDRENYDYFIKNKLRYADPKFIESNKIRRVSDVSKEFKSKLAKHKELINNGAYVRVLG